MTALAFAQGSLSRDGVPQQVARSEFGKAAGVGKQSALGSLPRAGGAHEKDIHDLRVLKKSVTGKR